MNLNNLKYITRDIQQRNNQVMQMQTSDKPLTKTEQTINKLPSHLKMQATANMKDEEKEGIESVEDIIRQTPSVKKVREYFKKLVEDLSENYDEF